MKRMLFTCIFYIFIIVSLFSQNNGPLRGKYNEISSTAQIGDNQLKYWLYRLPSNLTFDDLVAELCEYLENEWEFSNGSRGWPIYWNNMEEIKPNKNLSISVQTMMQRLNRNVSLHIYWNGNGMSPPQGMVINYFDSRTNSYTTLFFPCYL